MIHFGGGVYSHNAIDRDSNENCLDYDEPVGVISANVFLRFQEATLPLAP